MAMYKILSVGETGQTSHLRVGETGVGEMGVGETGVGETGVGEMGIPRQHQWRYSCPKNSSAARRCCQARANVH